MIPEIIIHVEDGLVQGVISDQPIRYIVADADVEGSDEEDILQTPPAFRKAIGGAKGVHANLYAHAADVNMEAHAEMLAALERGPARPTCSASPRDRGTPSAT